MPNKKSNAKPNLTVRHTKATSHPLSAAAPAQKTVQTETLKNTKKTELKEILKPKIFAENKFIDKKVKTAEIKVAAPKVEPEIKSKHVAKNGLRLGLGAGAQKATIFQSLAILISSGIDVLVALNSVLAETRNKQGQKIIKYLQSEIEGGTPLWKALTTGKILPEHLIAVIRIGEESGQLSENLQLVMEQMEKDREFNSRVKSAMLYPVFILIVISIVGTGIALFILPRLTQLYTSLNVELPLITQIVIAFGKFLEEKGAIAIPAFFITLILIFYILFINKRTRSLGHRILFNISLTHNIVQQIELSRFGYILGNLLKTGVPIMDAIKSLENSTTFYHYHKFYSYLKESILSGNSFQKSLANYKRAERVMPPSVQQMMSVAEDSGNLSSILLKIGDIYEKKNESTTKDLPVILEPLLIIIVWIGVAILALAVLLPIYSLVGNLTSLGGPAIENVSE